MKRFIKNLGYLVIALSITMLMSITVFAARSQWHQDSKGWTYSFPTGRYANTQWEKIKNVLYYFGEDNYMKTDWALINDIWYYFNKDGSLHTGWLNYNNDWYYLHPTEGMQIGWVKSNDQWYYMYENGIMAVDTKVNDFLIGPDGVWIEKTQAEIIAEQLGVTGDIKSYGSTFIAIDLTNQQVHLFANDEFVLTSNCVTGTDKTRYATPAGIFTLKGKYVNVVLRGPDYAAPVSYWMPFNGGIGLHDATWRSTFGSDIYKRNGSHGCINLPLNVAQTIYAHSYVGMTIICYY